MTIQGIFSYIRSIEQLCLRLGAIVVILILMPLTASAQVIINEIAWMGTSASSNAEWIELYNISNDSIVLDGWVIHAYDGSPKINLVGSIGAHEYYLLERTSDETLPNILADSIYSGSLGNTGERLQLINKTGEVIEDLDFTMTGWPGGDNVTKFTMQRVGDSGLDSWITGVPTPGALNATPDEMTENNSGASGSNSSTNASQSSSSTQVVKTEKEEIIAVVPDPKYTAKLDIPDYGVVGAPIPIKSIVKQDNKRDMVTGRFDWYLGDGAAHRYFKNTLLEHQYMYPGEYFIVLEYYSNSMKEEIDTIHRKKVTIVPDALIIDAVDTVGGVVIKNKSTRDIDLDKWTLETSTGSFTIPKHTIVRKGQTLTISQKVHKLNIGGDSQLELKNPIGTVVSVFEYGMLGP